jgi:hypothetical protein
MQLRRTLNQDGLLGTLTFTSSHQSTSLDSNPAFALRPALKMATQKEDDKFERDALDALESEAKEFQKDAEIERILNAFRLDAFVSPSPQTPPW